MVELLQIGVACLLSTATICQLSIPPTFNYMKFKKERYIQ